MTVTFTLGIVSDVASSITVPLIYPFCAERVIVIKVKNKANEIFTVCITD